MKKAGLKPTVERESVNSVAGAGQLGFALFDIGWRLAITVIVFLWGGSWLDRKLDTKPLFTITGFLLIIGSFVLIVRRILNQLPAQYGGNNHD